MHLIVMYFITPGDHYVPLNELSPEVVLKTTQLPEVMLVSESTVNTMAPNSMASTCKIASMDNTFTRT